ncbi:MAG TPA: multidrug effflux MFS transporter [Hyphomonas sp.]|nr:multidrug effflux MFS transporter [Hyphomonas sp.]
MTTADISRIAVDAPARKLTVGTLALLAGIAAIGALSTNIILPSFPSLAAQFGVESRALGVTLSSFFIAFALGQLVVGPLSDRFGRRRLVIGGMVVFLAGTVIGGLATSLDMLVFGRVVQGLGVCAASVLSRAIARDLFDGAALAKALSLVMIAMAAAPGFSPLLGSGLDWAFGWRATFVLVGLAGVVLTAGYMISMGETHPADRRAAHSVGSVARAYGGLFVDGRFILPAVAVSLIIGGLYAFFGASPAILVDGMGLSAVQLGLFFAATVFVVFGAGFAAPRLAAWLGAPRAALTGGVIALIGGAALLAVSESPGIVNFSAATVAFLLGMGIANPLGTAMTLQPFGAKAGVASALLGFLQMASAALGTALTAGLEMPPPVALGLLMTGGSAVGVMLLLVRLRLRETPE